MKLDDRSYSILKWTVLICLPAAGTAYAALSAIWGWPLADEIGHTVNAVCALIGGLIGISTAEYNREK